MSQPTKNYLNVLKKYFGHSEFRPMQWQIIRSIIEDRRDNCVIMATGYGKSLCYQYPPVYCNGLAIVVSPLISLMQDQVLALKVCNIPACYLGSAMSQKKKTMDDILEGKYRLVYLTPEWASGDYGKNFLESLRDKVSLTLVAVDEAHCVSQWGFDFRKSYRNIKVIRSLLPGVPILAVTATATPVVIQDICSNLMLKTPAIVKTSFDRPNLYLSVSAKGSNPVSDIRPFILRHGMKKNGVFSSTIIYCPTKKQADKICDELTNGGMVCSLYHADLSHKIREEVHRDFVKDVIPIVVATVAFGMGIDKPDVRTVIHYGAPKEIESYYQEIGRAGRDGLPANCHIFYSHADFNTNKYLMSSYVGKFQEYKEEMARLMENYLTTRDCRRRMLLRHFEPDFIAENNPRCCDNCSLGDKGKLILEIYDLTEDTLLLLQAVEALEGKYGITVPIYLLRGSTNKRLPKAYYSHRLYGKGMSKPEAWWKSLGRLLLMENLLVEDSSGFGKGWNKNKFPVTFTTVTKKGHQYIKNGNGRGIVDLKATPEMMAMVKPKIRMTGDSWLNGESVDIGLPSLHPMKDSLQSHQLSQEMEIYDKITELRSDLAQDMDCMPYMICSDVVLQEISKKKPLHLSDFKQFSGFTEAKIEKFGAAFIGIIKRVTDEKVGCEERKQVIGKKFQKFRAAPSKKKISIDLETADCYNHTNRYDDDDDDDDEDGAASFLTAIESVEQAFKNENVHLSELEVRAHSPLSVTTFKTCAENIESSEQDLTKTKALDEADWGESDNESLFQNIDTDAISNLSTCDSLQMSTVLHSTEVGTASKPDLSPAVEPSSLFKPAIKLREAVQKRRFQYDSSSEEEVVSVKKQQSPKMTRLDAILNTASRKKFVKSKRVCI